MLGVEEMYGLLACILTARSWDVVTTGIDQGPVTEDEVCTGSMYHWVEICEETRLGTSVEEVSCSLIPIRIEILRGERKGKETTGNS